MTLAGLCMDQPRVMGALLPLSRPACPSDAWIVTPIARYAFLEPPTLPGLKPRHPRLHRRPCTALGAPAALTTSMPDEEFDNGSTSSGSESPQVRR